MSEERVKNGAISVSKYTKLFGENNTFVLDIKIENYSDIIMDECRVFQFSFDWNLSLKEMGFYGRNWFGKRDDGLID